MRGESRWYGKLYANCCAFAWSFMISVVWSHSSNHSPPAVLSKVDTMPPLPTSSLSKFCQVAFQNKCQSHPKHQTFTCPSNCTYPFSIMVQWKITPNERKLYWRDSFSSIFHFQDYGRKGIYYYTPFLTFPQADQCKDDAARQKGKTEAQRVGTMSCQGVSWKMG